jgi:hypothetical protein
MNSMVASGASAGSNGRVANEQTAAAPADAGVANGAMIPETDEIRRQIASEQAQLDSQLNASDALGASLTLDRVEATLVRRDAEFRARLAAQRAILNRARQAMSEASAAHQEEYLAQLSEAFRATLTASDLAGPHGMTGATHDHTSMRRMQPDRDGSGRVAIHPQTRQEYLQMALNAFQATQRAYIWKRLLWSLRRHILFVLWILALILVAFFLSPRSSAPWLVLLIVIPGLAWLLASTVLAQPIERALLEQRRTYLRVWMMQLVTARIRIESDTVLALHGLAPPGLHVET